MCPSGGAEDRRAGVVCSPSPRLLFVFPPTSSDDPTVILGWMGPRCQGKTISTAAIVFFLLLYSMSVPPCACFRHLELTLHKMLCKLLSHLAQKDILLTLGTHVISKAFVQIKIWSCCCVVGYSTLLWRWHAENHSLTVTNWCSLQGLPQT